MKLIVALIQPPKLLAVVAALQQAGVERLTICDAHGFGRQGGQIDPAICSQVPAKMLRKLALEIVVNDDFVEQTVATLEEAAKSGAGGSIGDGKILVVPVEEVIQLNDGQRGPGAV